jgi:hypothetical protein
MPTGTPNNGARNDGWYKLKTIRQYEKDAKRVDGCLVHPNKKSVARRVYILRHGPLSSDVFVCHTCDNPWCILDKHHFPGSNGDNMRDAAAKGRLSTERKSAALRTAFARPEYKAGQSERSRKRWKSKAYRKRCSASMSLAMKKVWSDEDTAAKLIAISRSPSVRKSRSDSASNRWKEVKKLGLRSLTELSDWKRRKNVKTAKR